MTPDDLKRAQKLVQGGGGLIITDLPAEPGQLQLPAGCGQSQGSGEAVTPGSGWDKFNQGQGPAPFSREFFGWAEHGFANTEPELQVEFDKIEAKPRRRPKRPMSQTEIDKICEEQDAKMAEAAVPHWDDYRGNHHNEIPDPGMMQGGSVDFRRHLDKPLSDELWFDIVFRLRGFRLRVYRVDGGRWTDCWDNCTVWVDDEDIVREIQYTPPCPYKFDMDETVFIERPGVAVGHVGALAKAKFD